MYDRPENPINPSPPEQHTDVFPYVFSLSRLTEHHTAGGMSRFLPYLAELQPAMFVEVSPELAAERGLTHLDWAHVVTARSAIEGRVLVTDRLTPVLGGTALPSAGWGPWLLGWRAAIPVWGRCVGRSGWLRPRASVSMSAGMGWTTV